MNRLICADQMLDGNLHAELILSGFEDAAFKRKTKTGGLGQVCIEQAVYPRRLLTSCLGVAFWSCSKYLKLFHYDSICDGVCDP